MTGIDRMIRTLAAATPFTLAVASTGKLFAWSRFLDSLDSFNLVQPIVRAIAAPMIPAIEIVPLTMLLSGRRRTANAIAASFVVAVSTVVLAQRLHRAPPDCACFGLRSDYLAWKESTRSTLIRNGVLAVLAGVGLLRVRSS